MQAQARPVTRRIHGFTLIEVLIALAILAIGLAAVIATAGRGTRTAFELKQRTFARWVAQNEAVRLRTATTWPGTGSQEGTEKLAGEKWRWTADISQTEDPDLRRADIQVALDDRPDAEIGSLVVFIGRPMPAATLNHGLPPGQAAPPSPP